MSVAMSDKDVWIRKLEEEIDDLRQETDRKIETQRKTISDIFEVTMMFTDALHTLIISTASGKETFVPHLRFIRQIADETKKLDIDEGLKRIFIKGTNETIRISVERILRELSSLKISFDKMIDLLLRGLGMDLVKQSVSPDLIAELWGFPAVETFRRTIQE